MSHSYPLPIIEGSSGTVTHPSEESEIEANLSEYEEELRRSKGTQVVEEDGDGVSAGPVPISGRVRKMSNVVSPIVSPRQDSHPFLDDGDYGITLEDVEAHSPKNFLMTSELISKVHQALRSNSLLTSSPNSSTRAYPLAGG